MDHKPKTPTMDESPLILLCDGPDDEHDAGPPFAGPVGARIAGLCDLSPVRLPDAFELMRVFDRCPVGGVQVPMELAQFVCQQMVPMLKGRNVLFYGRSVCMAFGFEPKQPLQWQGGSYDAQSVLFSFAVIPDFDSRSDPDWSSWWQESEHVRRTADFLRPLVHPRARA